MLQIKPFCALLLMFLVLSVFTVSFAATQTDADSAIAEAKSKLASCYSTVQTTEAQGGNVTVLIATLNDAAGLLTKAELSYAAEDYSSASSFAQQAGDVLAGFEVTATAVKNSGMQNSNQQLTANAVIVGVAVAVFVGGVVFWVRLGHKKAEAKGE
jgi:cobalamin biosynthesis Mg chelatase CobN